MRFLRSLARIQALAWVITSLLTTAPSQSPVPTAVPVPAAVQDDLETLRRALYQPGEGARLEREAAIDQLLLRKDELAHGILARSLEEGDDPDGRARFLLDNLARKLVLAGDPVFGDERIRTAVLDIHVQSWVRLFVEGEAGLESRSSPDLRQYALRCLRNLSFRERRSQLERVTVGASSAITRAALRAAGGSRVLGLATWLAGRRGDV